MAIKNFLDSYEEFSRDTSKIIPPLFNKWCGLMAISATIGKRLWISRGHFKVHPNLYVMLMGEPGTGKGVACSLLQSLLEESGYEYFAADRSSKEKFLADLADGLSFNRGKMEDLFSSLSFGKDDTSGEVNDSQPKECFILAEEFQDFLGQNNTDFIAFLTKVWSYSGTYRYRLKTGKSVGITDPCINLLGGSTSATFSLTFPPEIAGQGFLARIILVGGDPSGVKISFPPPPNSALRSDLAMYLQVMKNECQGEIQISGKTFEALDSFNQEFGGVDDPRFKDYNVRRFTQFLKLCIISCAARMDREIRVEDIERADTILRETERWMPKAIGSFGKSKNADVTNKILQVLYTATKPVTMKELWRLVCDDLEKFQDLSDLLHKLSLSDRIQTTGGGWLPKIQVPKDQIKVEVKGK